MAKNYSDNLSEEVQKGMDQKASEGLWPSCAPLGYVNNRQTHTIEPDAKISHLILRAFELASTGQHSLAKLKRELFNEGLRAPRSKRELSKSQMQRMLSNPIYRGDFVWKNKLYRGKHQALVSRELYKKVQSQIGSTKKSKATKLNFAFTNTMTCAHCGCAITAQEKRKKSGLTYIYYHCTSGKGRCAGLVYLPEKKVSDWITEALLEIQIPEHVVEWTKQALRESQREEEAYRDAQHRLIQDRYRTVQRKIDKAYEDKLEGHIDLDFWLMQNERFNRELVELEAQQVSLRTDSASYVEKGVQLMELARQAPTLFKSMTPDEKRELVHLVLSNPRIENGTLRYDWLFIFHCCTQLVI